MQETTYKNHCKQIFFALLLSCIPALVVGEALTLTHVSADRSVMEVGQGSASVTFHLNKKARVELNIYDARGYLVNQVRTGKALPPGDHSVLWEGRDRQKRMVPPEVYYYTLKAVAASAEQVVYDLTDKTGGETVIVDEVEYDPKTETLTYVVPKSARVFLRAGLENGFVVRTLINGGIRTAGRHQMHWNGMDAGNVLSIKHHPKLRFFGEGYRLGQNSLIVVDGDKEYHRPTWIKLADLPAVDGVPARRQAGVKGRGLNRHAYHPADQCRDIEISLDLPSSLPKDGNGIPLVAGAVPLKTRVAPEDVLMMEAERSEIVYFLGNQLLYENEASYFPYTWTWQPQALPSGIHYLTAFVVGFNEHFGVATVKISVPETTAAATQTQKD